MKKKWTSHLKRVGVVLLLAAILAETTSSYAHAGTNFVVAEEQKEVTEEKEDRENRDTIEKTEDLNKEDHTEGKKDLDLGEPEKNEEDKDTEKNTEDTEKFENNIDAENTEENTKKEYIKEETKGEETKEEEMEKVPEESEEEIEKQYHFQDGDVASIQEWMRLYLPGGYGDILSLEENWWEALYDYERDLADFIRDSLVELDPHIYKGQDMEEIISIVEQGVSPAAFFKGTLFEGLGLTELYALREEGRTLDQVYEFLMAYLNADTENGLYQAWQAAEEMSDTEGFEGLLMALEKILVNLGLVQTYSAALGTLEAGDTVASLSVSATGYSGTGHGTIYKLTLGGQPALCLSMGRSARNGFRYFAGGGEYERQQDGIGYLLSYATLSGKYYATVQIAAWFYLQSTSLSESQVISRAASMINTSSDEAANMAELVWSYYQGACHHSNSYYRFRSANSNAQIVGIAREPSTMIYQPGTGGEGPDIPDIPEIPEVEPEFDSIEDSVTVSYEIRVRKADWQTKVGLEGCQVDIFENGEKIATVTTDANGEASYSSSKSASFQAEYCSNYEDLSEEKKAGVSGKTSRREAQKELEAKKQDFASVSYTYSTREISAPNGYVWQANEKTGSIEGNETITFDLTNERTLGSVELIKYDTESESGMAQGEARLDGAVYGIYGAENIMHGDKKTGCLLRKDELAATAIVGRSPKQDGDGYILNIDGSRHTANPGGTIAYEETPGRTAFGDLELGRYYIKELTPAPGYMLDETRYPVTFIYKNQMTKVEVRNEKASDADNQLTVDNGDGSHKVYSGDYVIKQGLKFMKTSDNAYDTELSTLEGVGFSIYLIKDLSKVKNGILTPLNGVWGQDDIKAFYDYDFTNEPKATLYKRTGREKWTEGDKKWLIRTGVANQYQVSEMFTDKEGKIETPELPFGTYIIIETTTPEYHVAAKPFIARISQDGGVLYTDAGRQTIEKTYTEKEGIRYGDRKITKEREGRLLQKERIINNTITQAYLRIVKTDEEFLVSPGTYVKAEELVRGTVLKEEAKYRLRCLSLETSEELLKVLNWRIDGEGYLSYYYPGGKLLTGTREHPYETSFLRKNGKIADSYITLPRELPVGTYELTELTAPTGYVVNGAEQTVKDTSTEGKNSYELVDAPKGKTVFTIENGSVYPDGQIGIGKYALCDAYGNLTVTVLQKNQEQKGIIEIYKHGEQVSGAGEDKETLLDKLSEDPFRYLSLQEVSQQRDVVFTYEDAPVEGAGFQIIAAEDIYSQEIDIKLLEEYGIDTAKYRIWKKGDVVAEITTDRSGYAYASQLYIGNYKIRETVAGSGFVLNTKEEEFSITPQKQTVSFDIKSADYKNERQRLKLEVEKKDKESGKNLAGAVYGLYAGEDICTGIVYNEEKAAWILREEPEVLFTKGSLLATCITDSEGKAVFDEDLPLGQYQIRELEAPIGYLLSEEEINVDGSYEGEKGGQDVGTQEHSVVLENQITRVRFQKLDMTNGHELAGALLEVWELPFTEEKEVLGRAASQTEEVKKDSWISTGPSRTMHMTEGLQPGRTYAFREAEPAPGYVTAEDIYFRLEQLRDEGGKLTDEIGVYLVNQLGEEIKKPEEEQGQEQQGQTEASKKFAEDDEGAEDTDVGDVKEEPEYQEAVIMEDDITKVQISKKDIATNEELPGALLELYDENGILMETWVSSDTPHYMEQLPIGTYRLVEKKAPEGYGYAEDVIFRVLDTNEIQTVEMKDGVETEPEPEPGPEPEQPETPEETAKEQEEQPDQPENNSASESHPQEVGAPELGDRHEIGLYILALLFLSLLIITFVVQCKRDGDE